MKDGIERAYREQRPRLIGWMSGKIGKEEAEDALHDVIVRSLVNLDSLEGVRDLTAWLWRSAARAVIDVWRKRRRRGTVESAEGSDWIIDAPANLRTDAAELHLVSGDIDAAEHGVDGPRAGAWGAGAPRAFCRRAPGASPPGAGSPGRCGARRRPG